MPAPGSWSIRDILQGRPLGHPAHPLFAHFPAGLFPAALLWDLASQFRPEEDFGRAARLSIGLGLAGAVPAAVTGLVDYLGMVGGSRKKRLATYHLAAQLTSVGAFGLSFLLRLREPGRSRTPPGPWPWPASACWP